MTASSRRWTGKPRTLGGGIAKEDNAVCWAVVYKVAILLQSMQHVRFRHRDLHDGNVLIRLKTQPVTSCDDVDVWLVDFGKAMALVNEDGELDSDGNLMSSLDGGSVSTVWNPTADTLRLCCTAIRPRTSASPFSSTVAC